MSVGESAAGSSESVSGDDHQGEASKCDLHAGKRARESVATNAASIEGNRNCPVFQVSRLAMPEAMMSDADSDLEHRLGTLKDARAESVRFAEEGDEPCTGPTPVCQWCHLNELCRPAGACDTDEPAALAPRRVYLEPQETLHREQAPFRGLHVVRVGALKAYTISEDGSEQVAGFFLPGELVGLMALGTGRHRVCTVALETTSLCMIPLDKLNAVSAGDPLLQLKLLRLVSCEFSRELSLYQLWSGQTAEGRLAAVLVDLAARLGRNAKPLTSFTLPMTRLELGAYLGMASETISRQFTRLEKAGVIHSHGRDVSLLDFTALTELAGDLWHQREPAAAHA
jgi:CRP/FNR family transcriptional regulator, anaerobic regulatory protein